jgi:hypothetical protein
MGFNQGEHTMYRSAGIGLALIVALSACETLPWEKSSSNDTTDPGAMTETGNGTPAPVVAPPGLVLSAEQRFADVPLPAGVKEDVDRTYVYESRDLQIGRMVYTIRETVNEVAQFYIRECPAAGWSLTTSMQASGAQLSFDKSNKHLDIMIRNVGLPRGGTELVLNLTPKDAQ